MTIGEFELIRPRSVAEATSLLAEHGDDARPIAGGTALVLFVKHRFSSPRYLVPLWGLPELGGIAYNEATGLRIGASVTLSKLLAFDAVQQRYPALVDALQDLGNVRVRNVATIGGHLAYADPNLNLPPALIGYGATVHVAGPAGERSLRLEDLFVDYYETALQPGELIVEVRVPPPAVAAAGAFLNFKPLSHADWPALGVAGFAAAQDGQLRLRAILSGVALTPLLVDAPPGRPDEAPRLADDLADRAFEAASPVSDNRGSAEYKRAMTRVFTRRALDLAVARMAQSAAGTA